MEVMNNSLRHNINPWRASIVALTLFATACQDVPTSIAPVLGRSVNAAQPNGQHLGQTPFLCTVGHRAPSAPNGWQTRQDTFYFSRGDLDARGRTVQYMYRRNATDGTPLVSVDCRVPYTESALRRVDRWLGVEANSGVAQFKARDGMVSTQGCVSDGMCTLEPILVQPPPSDTCSNCDPPYPPRAPGGGDTGGGTPPPPNDSYEAYEGDAPLPEDYRPECDKDASGYCIRRKVTDPAQWARIGEQIESIREDVHECREAKSILRSAFGAGMDAGRIQVWDGKWLLDGGRRQRTGYIDSDAAGRIVVLDGYWAERQKDVAVHEALHVYLNNINSPLQGPDNERWVGSMEEVCEQ